MGTPENDECSKCGLPAAQHRVRTSQHVFRAGVIAGACAKCGKPEGDHDLSLFVKRPEHKPVGIRGKCRRKLKDGTVCGVSVHLHRSDEARAKRKERDDARKGTRDQSTSQRRIVGIDGEGVDAVVHGVKKHLYTYIAAVDEHGELVSEARNPKGLTHDECAAMLGKIPEGTLKFGYMFSYDITKIIEPMPFALRHYLMRPETRIAVRCAACGKARDGEDDGGVRGACPRCGDEKTREVFDPIWWNGRGYDFFAGSFTIIGKKGPRTRGQKKRKRRRVKVWDCFRFFGSSFVSALEDWKIGTPEEVAEIQRMKEKRGSFAEESAHDVERYCRRECHLLAVLMRKVITSHETAGIPLKRFEGAGSTASALLRKNAVHEYRGVKLDHPRLSHAIDCAFFGGRFENSAIGVIEKPVWGFDISSAYPYAQATRLTCLKCGVWREIRGDADDVRRRAGKETHALLQFRVKSLGRDERAQLAWGPLPCRTKDGSIVYGMGFTGWAWREELFPVLEAALWRNLVTLTGAAWVYTTECAHEPWKYVPGVYRERVAWGKEGPGKCLKLGVNAGYGKTAQRAGKDPPFRHPVWAGITTATTRGQLAHGIGLATNAWNVHSVATDGIYASELLALPAPEDTGTNDLEKPLGGWETSPDPRLGKDPEGCFFVKPGLYYRPSVATLPETDRIKRMKEIRARGIGRREVMRDADRLIEGFHAWDRKDMDHAVTLISRRFWGAKYSAVALSRCTTCKKNWVGVPEKGCPSCRQVGNVFKVDGLRDDKGRLVYGTWAERPVDIKFDPWPKRERVLQEGGTFSRLFLRDLGGIESASYTGETTPEGQASREQRDDDLEQPDWYEESSFVEDEAQ